MVCLNWVYSLITRMHSSRMRTARSLTVYCSLLPGGGGTFWGGVSAPGGVPGPGCVPGLGGSVPGGCVLPGGVGVWPGGVSAPRGHLVQGGVSGLGGLYSSMHWGRHPPPHVDRFLDTRLWKYYLGPTSLRPVTRWWCFFVILEFQ